MTRCAPGRFPDRTKKWTDEETRLICESNISSTQDLLELLQVLNSRKDRGNVHSVDSLRRKVEYLGVSGMMPRFNSSAATTSKQVPRLVESSSYRGCNSDPLEPGGDAEILVSDVYLQSCGGLTGYLARMDSEYKNHQTGRSM